MPRKFRKERKKALEITPAIVLSEREAKGLMPGHNLSPTTQPHNIPRKWTETVVQDLAAKLLTFSEREDSLVLMDFFADHGLTYKLSYELANTYDCWADAKNRAKARIGARREKLAIQGKADAGMVRHTQATYDDDLRMQLQQRNNLAIGLSGDPQKVQINVVNYGNTQP